MMIIKDDNLGEVEIVEGVFMYSSTTQGVDIYIENTLPSEVYTLAENIRANMKRMQELIKANRS